MRERREQELTVKDEEMVCMWSVDGMLCQGEMARIWTVEDGIAV